LSKLESLTLNSPLNTELSHQLERLATHLLSGDFSDLFGSTS
jgi:hypothetical protein